MILLSLLTVISGAWAADAAKPVCTEALEQRGDIQVQVQWNADNSTCYLSVHPFDSDNLIYRDFLFAQDGMLMVFNSFGEGPESTTTGARELYFFPRTQLYPTYAWNDQLQRLEVTHTNGEKYFFNYKDNQFSGTTNGTVKEDPSVNRQNKGGVEITGYKGLMLDVGFTMGESPSAITTGAAVFTDQNSKTCDVKNDEVFKYVANGDDLFKFDYDRDLVSFMKGRCPALNVAFPVTPAK